MTSRRVLIFLSVVTVLRGVWLAWQGVSPQEAYYWMCSERLAAAFFDGPPGTAVLVRALGIATFGSLELLRLAWPVWGFVAAWLAWVLARSLYTARVGGWVVLTLNALPVFNAHALTVGPAMPALVLVLAGMLASFSALEGRRKDWLLAAALFALATLFRYEAVLVPLGLCLAQLAVLTRRERPDAVVLAALVGLPALALWSPLAWNAAWQWIPLAGGTFQTWWRPRPGGWWIESVAYFREFSFAAGLALLGGFIGLFIVARQPGRARFLLALAGPAALWAFYQIFLGRDFSGAAWLALVPLLIFLAAEGATWRWTTPVAGGIVALALLSTGLLLREEGHQRGVWAMIASEMHSATREMPASEGGGFLIAEKATQAAALAIYFKSTGQTAYPPVFVPESPALTSQFGIWPSYGDFIAGDQPANELFTEQKGTNPFLGRNALYLGTDLPQTIKGAFAEVLPLKQIRLPDGSQFVIFLCLDYQTLPL
jgi:hypothetical protein